MFVQPEESHVASLPGHGGRARFRAQRPLVEEEDQPPFQRQRPDKALLGALLGPKDQAHGLRQGIKVIDARGIDAVVADLIARGRKL